MERAGIGRTIFYRHFDDLGDLLMRAGGRRSRSSTRPSWRWPRPATEPSPRWSGRRSSLPSTVYRRHGPLLRAVAEAAAADEQIAAGQAPIRERFDELVAQAAAIGSRLNRGPARRTSTRRHGR